MGKKYIKHTKYIIKNIVCAVVLLTIYVQCTKIGSSIMLETSGLHWYVNKDAESTKEELNNVSSKVHDLFNKKNINTNNFDVNIVLCNSTNEFLWKALVWDETIQGVTRCFFKTTIVNKSSISQNKMDGNDNKLSDVIAHELCHIYLSKKLSLLDYTFLESWKNEGYCEYISEHSTLDIEKGLSWFMTNNQAEIEKTDRDKILFFYFTSRLKTDYLLGYKKVPFDYFIDTDYDEELLEEEIRTALKKGEYKFPSEEYDIQ